MKVKTGVEASNIWKLKFGEYGVTRNKGSGKKVVIGPLSQETYKS